MSDTLSPLLLRDPLVGQRLGEYEVIEPIGEGGMGVVYRALHPLIKKRVAIKVLKPGVATDATHVKRLIAEAEAVNAIGHRNIVDIFGLGQLDDGRPYVVMEFLEGEPLDAYLRRNPRLPLHEVLTLLLEIGSPLAAAHAKGVIHRDLKPSNVFRCVDEGAHFVKLLDFGLAKRTAAVDGTSAQTSQHIIAGTPDYMAPEQARAMPVSNRTDLYAFGVMAFEMLTGELPYSGMTPMDVMMAHVSQPVPSVLRLSPSVPVELDRLVQSLMAKDPAQRPASMGDVRAEVKAIISRLSPTGTYQQLAVAADRSSSSNETPVVRALVTEARALPVPSSNRQAVTAKPRRRWVVGLVVVALVAVITGLALQREPAPPPPPPIAPPVVVALPSVPVPPPPLEPALPPPEVARPRVAEPTENPVELPPDVKAQPTGPRATPRKAPTAAQLTARVDRLRVEFGRLTSSRPDRAVEQLLGKYKLESYAVETVAERLALEGKLNQFDKQVLGPLRSGR
jgi:serine/threonine protein kinase